MIIIWPDVSKLFKAVWLNFLELFGQTFGKLSVKGGGSGVRTLKVVYSGETFYTDINQREK